MAVSHVDAIMRVYDPPNTAIPGSSNPYYINPIGIQSITLSVVLRAADRYAYTGCGSTAYCYLFYLGMDKYIYT
jgi:hypothetical protein